MSYKAGFMTLAFIFVFPLGAEGAGRRSRIPLQQGPNGRMGFPIKLYVSIKEDIRQKDFEPLKKPLQQTSEHLYHATGGYFYIKSVTFQDRRSDGHFRFSFKFRGIPHGGRNIPMGPQHWWDRTIMHEIGHMKLGLWDEYRYRPTCPKCVMALNGYNFCHDKNHRGHTKRRSSCWTRMRKLFPDLAPYDERPSTRGQHAPPIEFKVINRGRK